MNKMKYDWDSVEVKLGVIPDNQIAKELGCTRERVRQIREKNGVGSAPSNAWLPPPSPVTDRILDDHKHQLGVLSDVEISRLACCSPYTVFQVRKAMGILPRLVKQRLVNRVPQEYQALLGKMTDAEISRRSGFGCTSIHKLRVDLGIPKYSIKG